MSKIKQCGVYVIRNLKNGKMYVGSTINSFNSRWNTHKRLLKRNRHPNSHLQAAYNKYSKEFFVFQIVEITNPLEARKRESYYINLYGTLDPGKGYNIELVNEDGSNSMSEITKEKLRSITKKMWEEGRLNNDNKRGKPSWNKGLKCDNISLARRKMFNSVGVYKEDILIATFRSVVDLSEWTKENNLPGLQYYTRKYYNNTGKKTSFLLPSNIQRAIRTGNIYRGLKFKRTLPLPPEMGVVKWENCWEGEIPNQQPSQPLTKLEGSETND